MNTVNTLLNQNIPFPVNWFISTPSLYGTNVIWDIIGGRSATLYNQANSSTVWKPYSNKPGSLGGCITSVGSPDNIGYINIGHTVRKPFTVTFWAKVSSTNSDGYLFSSSSYGIRTNTSSGNQNKVTMLATAGNYSTITFNYNEWTHFAFSTGLTSGDVITAYINGKNAISYTLPSTITQCTIRSIGNISTSALTTRQVFGDYDDIMIFDSILSEEMIRSIYKNAFTRKAQMSQFLMSQISYDGLINMLMGGQF